MIMHATIDDRIRSPPPAVLQCIPGQEECFGYGLTIATKELLVIQRFILRNFSTARDVVQSRDRVDRASLKRLLKSGRTSEDLTLPEAVDNVEAWLAASRILQDLDARLEAPTDTFAHAVFGYLFQSQLRAEGAERLELARQWDVLDIVEDLHRLGRLYRFQPRFPLNPYLTRVQQSTGIPRPDVHVPMSVPAPRTTGHPAASGSAPPASADLASAAGQTGNAAGAAGADGRGGGVGNDYTRS